MVSINDKIKYKIILKLLNKEYLKFKIKQKNKNGYKLLNKKYRKQIVKLNELINIK